MAAKSQPQLPAGRIRLTRAAKLFDVGDDVVREWVAAGVLTRQDPPECRGQRKAWHVWADEVHVLLNQGPNACRDYRTSKGRA